ncbi:MAG: hypothetical protein CMI74_05165 [Candidatus Pelagibacter sp.]|nr:hypothetical protein [Candidatus Pelagibacter sp.]|tara:strand:+ start:62608 stop:62916 length:309 start_codon:yes stop_codon:yes gene_type:complete
MSEFDKRQKGFEKKHVMDEEKKFKIESRRNKYIGEWVSDILDYNEDQKKNYIQEVIKADFKEAGEQDVFRKLKEDLKSKNIPDDEIRKKMDDLNEKAKTDFN